MSEKPKLALDFDGTLAATHETAFDLMFGENHDYSYGDIESWSWGLEQFGKMRYLSAIWQACQIRPDEVEPMEENAAQLVSQLGEHFRVDIVTAQPEIPGVDEAKLAWLDEQMIPYEDFVVVEPETSKANLDYDYFVDERPGLPSEASEDQTVFLYDQPYNRDIEGDHIRVESLREVVKWAKVQEIRENVANEVREALVEALNE